MLLRGFGLSDDGVRRMDSQLRYARHTCIRYEYRAEIVQSRTNNVNPMFGKPVVAVHDRHPTLKSEVRSEGTGQAS